MNGIELLSIQVGLPQEFTSPAVSGPDSTASPTVWTTGFLKQPVNGPVWVGRTNIEGDGQGSPKTHGGPEKAVCVYPMEHYAYWQQELNLPELRYGALAENFTVRGQIEEQACIGDTIRFGEVSLQISQPRPPCWRLSRWWQRQEFVARMEETGRTGWYCRVLTEGYVEAGATIELLERPYPEWTIALANHLLYGKSENFHLLPEQMEALASCRFLAESWRDSLLAKKSRISS